MVVTGKFSKELCFWHSLSAAQLSTRLTSEQLVSSTCQQIPKPIRAQILILKILQTNSHSKWSNLRIKKLVEITETINAVSMWELQWYFQSMLKVNWRKCWCALIDCNSSYFLLQLIIKINFISLNLLFLNKSLYK